MEAPWSARRTPRPSTVGTEWCCPEVKAPSPLTPHLPQGLMRTHGDVPAFIDKSDSCSVRRKMPCKCDVVGEGALRNGITAVCFECRAPTLVRPNLPDVARRSIRVCASRAERLPQSARVCRLWNCCRRTGFPGPNCLAPAVHPDPVEF